jgi:hypothetical protein
MIRWTHSPVSGSEHSPTILPVPSVAVWSMVHQADDAPGAVDEVRGAAHGLDQVTRIPRGPSSSAAALDSLRRAH